MRKLPSESGFTLVESLVVLVILRGVLAIATSILASGTVTFSRATTLVELREDLAGAKNVVLDDLSIAGYRPDDLVAAGPFVPSPVDSFQAVGLGTNLDSVAFWGDVDSNGTTDRVCYDVVAGVLRRSIQAKADACGTVPWDTLATEVQALDLTFLPADRTAAALTQAQVLAGEARYVQVEITIELPAKGGAVTKALRGETAIRNW